MTKLTLVGRGVTQNGEIHDFIVPHYPWMVELPTKDVVTAAYEWCREQYGISGNLPRSSNFNGWLDFSIDLDHPWVYNWYWFYFKDPDHATMCKMVWG